MLADRGRLLTRRSRTAALVVSGAAVATSAVVALVVALVVAGGAPPDLPPGLDDPGPVVGWGLRVAGVAGLLAGALTTGSLLVAGWLGPERAGPMRRQLRTAAAAAAGWAAMALVGFVLTVCDSAGTPLSQLGPALLVPWRAPAPATAHLVSAGLAVLAGALCLGATSVGPRRRARITLLPVLAAALPVPVLGHLAGTPDGGSALSGVVVHVLAALVWTGGLAGVVLHLATDRAALAAALPRFSTLALAAYVALTGSGLIAVAATLPLTDPAATGAWTSGYAGVVGAKVTLLVLLGGLGLWHRRRMLPRAAGGESRAFVRLATVELVVMAAAAGLATALTRTPGPSTTASEGSHAVGSVAPVEEPSAIVLVTAWRLNAVVLVVLAAALLGYLRARARLTAEGVDWPRPRTASFVGGLVVVLVAVCSPAAGYASVLVSVHLTQLLTLVFLAPGLLLLGRPAALARAAHGRDLPPPVRRALGHPAVGATATCLLVLAVHRTSLGTLSLASPWWHLVVLAAAVACGVTLWWPMLGDTAPIPAGPAQAGWLLTVAACLALLGIQLLDGGRLFASAWFLELRLGWADPVEDQRSAGIVAVVVAGVVGAWAAGVLVRYRSVPGGGHSLTSTLPRRSSLPIVPWSRESTELPRLSPRTNTRPDGTWNVRV